MEKHKVMSSSKNKERLVLTDRDRNLFLSVLDRPPKLQGKLKSAIAEYQVRHGN